MNPGMWGRRGIDARNGIIFILLTIIAVLYTTSPSAPRLPDPHFSSAEKAFDAIYSEWRTHPSPIANVPGSVVTAIPQRQQQPVDETEITHPDGITTCTRTTSLAPNSTLLILTLSKDATSWGSNDVDLPRRTIHDYLDILLTTQLDLNLTSLALWTSSTDQYHLFRLATTRIPFARLTIHLDPSPGNPTNRSDRHSDDIQSTRRSLVARLRNTLLLRSLGPEPHHLWLDADINYFSPGIVQRMLKHSTTNPDAGIITARAEDDRSDDFDRNAWSGSRPGPSGTQSSDPDVANWEKGQKQRHVSELTRWTRESTLIPLTTVGATILYMRAALVWQGLNFPSYYVVGTRWGRDGWDGIESEGICYAARNLVGGKCWVLGGRGNYVRHTNE